MRYQVYQIKQGQACFWAGTDDGRLARRIARNVAKQRLGTYYRMQLARRDIR